MDHQPKHTITQKDIARELGISIITVQRAINGTGYVSDDLKARIRDCMKRRNYRLHRGARSLARGTRETVALFSTQAPRSFWSEVQRGVDIAARQSEYAGFTAEYRQVPKADTKAYLEALRAAAGRKVRAVGVVNNHEYDMARVFALLEELEIPYITFNIDAPTSRRLCYVGPDYEREGRIVGNYLGQVSPEGGEILVIHSPIGTASMLPGADIVPQRVRGLERYFAEHDGLRVRFLQLDRSPLRQLPKTIAEQFPGLLKRLGGLYFPHLERSDIADLFEALHPRVPVVTSLYSPFTLAHLKAGRIAAIVYQDPVLQGYLAVTILERFLASGTPPQREQFLITQSLMLRENTGIAGNHLAELGG